MGITEAVATDEDEIFEPAEGIRIYVDCQSLELLDGTEIDFNNDLLTGGFILHNPNAVSTCGCGHSFRTTESQGSPNGCGL